MSWIVKKSADSFTDCSQYDIGKEKQAILPAFPFI